MEIKRVNGYSDPRFSREVLCQHGAFLVDGAPWAFRIVSDCAAVVSAPAASQEALCEAVEAFRYYSGHVTEFYGETGDVLLHLPPVERREVEIDRLQPSQFSVDREKCAAVGEFVRGTADLVIPVSALADGALAILDGHTRLYTAWQRGIRTAMAYRCAQDNGERADTAAFVREARRRRIFHIRDLAVYSPAEQEEKWLGWCKAYFAVKEGAAGLDG